MSGCHGLLSFNPPLMPTLSSSLLLLGNGRWRFRCGGGTKGRSWVRSATEKVIAFSSFRSSQSWLSVLSGQFPLSRSPNALNGPSENQYHISHSDVLYRGILAACIDPAATTIQLSNGTRTFALGFVDMGLFLSIFHGHRNKAVSINLCPLSPLTRFPFRLPAESIPLRKNLINTSSSTLQRSRTWP